MRRLVQCPQCRRQYDASSLATGSRFRCRCGTTVDVAEVKPVDAAVVRCRQCGGTRERGATACAFCGSDFTIHERDMDTICPSCFARISDRSRYCHSCGTAIVPEEAAGSETEWDCPVCGGGRHLRGRAFAGGLSALECVRCAGLWLGVATFDLLLERARGEEPPIADAVTTRAATSPATVQVPTGGRIYRRCPVCSQWMHRWNFGRTSGVVIDRCHAHGVWFDAMELDGILRWVRKGGELVERERRAAEERARAIAERFKVEPKAPEEYGEVGGYASSSLLGGLIGLLFDKMPR